MLILGIDTSTKAASVALLRDGELLVDYTLNNERTHSEKILEMIDNAFKISRTDISEVDAFAVSEGPGSFTGLRIGAATVKGMAEAGNKPVYTASSLRALYESVRVFDSLPVCVLMDAGREEVYTAVFDKGVYVLCDCCMSVSEIASYMKEHYEKALFTGDGVLKYKEKIKEIFKEAEFAEERFLYGSGSGVIKAALKSEPKTPSEVAPVYLKVSQAERMRNAK